jgi:hypothetical protein
MHILTSSRGILAALSGALTLVFKKSNEYLTRQAGYLMIEAWLI